MTASAKLQAILKSKDAHKVKHLAENYFVETALLPYTVFSKEFTAPAQHDFEIVIQANTSDQVLSIESQDGQIFQVIGFDQKL